MVLSSVVERTIAAHGDASDVGILPIVGQWEHATGNGHQFLTDESTVVLIPLRMIDIERIIPVRKHNCDALQLTMLPQT